MLSGSRLIAGLALLATFLMRFLRKARVALAGGSHRSQVRARCCDSVRVDAAGDCSAVGDPAVQLCCVLMDDSASMKLTDDGSHTRLDAVKQLMSANSAFYSRLADRFKLRTYKFSTTADRVEKASELSGSGDQTNLTPRRWIRRLVNQLGLAYVGSHT